MIIVIDGYNLLKAIFPRVKGRLDKQRDQLIRQLGFYKKQKSDTIKGIVLVFDGGRISRATREVRAGIVVIFSEQKMSADDWIIDYVERNQNKELMLVTRDRELIAQCRKHNVEVLKVMDFYRIMQTRLLERVESDLQADQSGADQSGADVQKYERDDEIHEIDSEALDLLMEQASVDLSEKEEDRSQVSDSRKGRADTPSKKEKKRLAKLKKL